MYSKERNRKGADLTNKFEDVDVLSSLYEIMRQNTVHYQSDFNIDVKMIREAVRRGKPEDKQLLWFSCPSGTFCAPERTVFLKDTGAYNTWLFYGEQTRDKLLAYSVELTGVKDGRVKGNLYELDYPQHMAHVKRIALPVETITLTFPEGFKRQFNYNEYKGAMDGRYGKVSEIHFEPGNEDQLQALLHQEHMNRERLAPGRIGEHIRQLAAARVLAEAERLQNEFKKLADTGGHEGARNTNTHYYVRLSPEFSALSNREDQERLCVALPYKSLFISVAEGSDGQYAIISKNENLDQPIRRRAVRGSLSVVAQIKQENLAAAKMTVTKRKEMER